MRFSKPTFNKAVAELKRRRDSAEIKAAAHRQELFIKCPEASELDRMISASSREFSKIMALRDKKAIEQKFNELKNKNLAYQEQMKDILSVLGLPADYLDVKYTCEKCKDTGSVNGEMCACLKELIKQTAFQELCKASPLELCSFDDFNIEYYPDDDGEYSSRDIMQSIYNYCRCYADDFSNESPNICMFGSTGLGKTHLSLAVAREVIEKGFGIVYGSCPNLVAELEREKFGKSNDNTEEALLSCDLLILDDLGAEFSTQFTVSAIYNIINTRLLKRLPTIISTNLSIEGIQQKYTERIASRIIGEYTLLKFTGKDVRQIKNN